MIKQCQRDLYFNLTNYYSLYLVITQLWTLQIFCQKSTQFSCDRLNLQFETQNILFRVKRMGSSSSIQPQISAKQMTPFIQSMMTKKDKVPLEPKNDEKLNKSPIKKTNQNEIKYKKYETEEQFAPYFINFKKKFGGTIKLKTEEAKLIEEILLVQMNSRFSFESLKEVCRLTSELFKVNNREPKYFWFVVKHIYLYFNTRNSIGFSSRENMIESMEEIEKSFLEISLDYPPGGKGLEVGCEQIENYRADILPDLFNGNPITDMDQFQDFIKNLNENVSQYKGKFQQTVYQLFSEHGLINTLKIGLKIPPAQNKLTFLKAFLRVIQKVYADYIDPKMFMEYVNFQQSYEKYVDSWYEVLKRQVKQFEVQEVYQEEIILDEGQLQIPSNQKNETLKFQVFDLIRCKCYHKSVDHIKKSFHRLKAMEANNIFKILIVKNRLKKSTCDVLIVVDFQGYPCEIQMAVESEEQSMYMFAHKLYELSREPSGIILATIIMLFAEESQDLQYLAILSSACTTKKSQKAFNYYVTIDRQFGNDQMGFVNKIKQQYTIANRTKKQPSYLVKGWNIFMTVGQVSQSSFLDEFTISSNGRIQGFGVDSDGWYSLQGRVNGKKIRIKVKQRHLFLLRGQKIGSNQYIGDIFVGDMQKIGKFSLKHEE